MPVEKGYKSSEKVDESDVDDEQTKQSSDTTSDSDENNSTTTNSHTKTRTSTRVLDSSTSSASNTAKRKVTFSEESGKHRKNFSGVDAQRATAGDKFPRAKSHNYTTTPESGAAIAREIPLFHPPPGFERSPQRPHPDQQSTLFDEASLRGKQIWHITAPVSVPVSSISKISRHQLDNGGAVLQHRGVDYEFASGSTTLGSTKLLVPTEDGQEYQFVKVAFSRALRLQRMQPAQSTHTSMGSISASKSELLVKSQQNGLLARYRPPGFENPEPSLNASSEDASRALEEASDVEESPAAGMASKDKASAGHKRTAEGKKTEQSPERTVKRSKLAESVHGLAKKEAKDAGTKHFTARPTLKRASSIESSSATSSDGEDESEESEESSSNAPSSEASDDS